MAQGHQNKNHWLEKGPENNSWVCIFVNGPEFIFVGLSLILKTKTYVWIRSRTSIYSCSCLTVVICEDKSVIIPCNLLKLNFWWFLLDFRRKKTSKKIYSIQWCACQSKSGINQITEHRVFPTWIFPAPHCITIGLSQ